MSAPATAQRWTASTGAAPARCPRTTPTRTAASPRAFRVRQPSGSRSCPDRRPGRAPASRSPSARRVRHCRRAVRAASAAGSRPVSAASTVTAAPHGRHRTTAVRRCSVRSCRTTAWGRRRRRLPRQGAPIALPHIARTVSVDLFRRVRRSPRAALPTSGAGASTRGAWHRLGGVGCRRRSRTARARRETARAASSRHRIRCRRPSPAGGCGRGPWRRSAACAPRRAAVPGWTRRWPRLLRRPRRGHRRGCWVPSTPPRGVVLGHSPSCSPAMTTTSHSPPSAACALTSVTPSMSVGGVARRR